MISLHLRRLISWITKSTGNTQKIAALRVPYVSFQGLWSRVGLLERIPCISIASSDVDALHGTRYTLRIAFFNHTGHTFWPFLASQIMVSDRCVPCFHSRVHGRVEHLERFIHTWYVSCIAEIFALYQLCFRRRFLFNL